MKRFLFSSILFIISIITFTQCHHPIDGEKADVPHDTVKTEVALVPLPDTIYPSVEALEYSITLFDSLTDGQLSGLEDPYSNACGIFTFRGNHQRNAAFHGTVKGRPDTVVVDWVFKTGFDKRETKFGTWGGGTGWTGQPLYV